MLTELILYSNQVESIPKSFSLPLLKLLKISMNKISTFRLGYCPFLETIDAKDNIISEMDCFSTCPTLTNLDISFNQLQTLTPILYPLCFSPCIKYLKFNDNPFLANRYNTVEPYVSRLFPYLKEVNSLPQNIFRTQSLIPNRSA